MGFAHKVGVSNPLPLAESNTSRSQPAAHCLFTPCASGCVQVVAVGTPITRRPPRRSVQAVLPHTALTLDSGGKRYSPHIAQSVGHANSRTVSGTCQIERCFSLVHALPSPTSVEDKSSLFGWFIGVGSEVARFRAGHRPPLKLHGRFSRMQLSRRVRIPRCQ